MKRKAEIFLAVLCMGIFLWNPVLVQAKEEKIDLEEQYIEDLLSELNFTEIDTFLQGAGSTKKVSFHKIVETFLQGDLKEGAELLKNGMKDAWIKEWKSNRTAIIHILIIALIAATLTGFSDIFQNRQISEVSYYMVYMLLLTLLMKAFGTASSILTETLDLVMQFMKILMPSLFLTFGFSGEHTAGVAFYEWILILITVVQWVLQKILLPCIHIYVLLMLVNQMVKEDFISKMAELFRTATEWIQKTLLAAVMGFNLVQGMIAPAVDRFKKDMITKTAGVIPGVGNVLDSVSDLVLGSAILIRNSIGAAALLILALLCLLPAIRLLIFSAGYKLAAAAVQPVSDARIVECISSVGEGMMLLTKTIFTSGVLFFLTLAVLCMATGR